MRRSICIVTGTRAEYGLLKPLIDEFKGERSVRLQVIATGMHLSPEFGLTYKEIETDRVEIDEKVEMLLSSDTPVGISKSIGLGVISFAEAYQRLKPDIVVVLGDRFEILSAVIAALVARVPVAHLHGGEATEGAIDEAIRHSITKMSHLHFTSTEQYRQKVIQLGESPSRVFNVGAIGIDNIETVKPIARKRLENMLGIKFVHPTFLVTFHPVTLERSSSERYFSELLEAFSELKSVNLIFTKPNSDTDGRVISQLIDRFVAQNTYRAKAFVSLGRARYLSVMRYVDGIVGNSSSGIIEAPSLKKGTVNIGNRQKGRIFADSVISCEPQRKAIIDSIRTLLSDHFQKRLKDVSSPYGDGGTAKKISKVLSTYPLDGITRKSFYVLDSNRKSGYAPTESAGR